MQITDNWFLSYFIFFLTSLEQIPRNYDKHKDDSNMCFYSIVSVSILYLATLNQLKFPQSKLN